MAQRGGNERYHAHGPRSGRERPPGRGDAWAALQELAGPASLWPRLLDAGPAQRRSGSPLHVLLRDWRAAQPGA